MTVSKLNGTMSVDEFVRWQAYNTIYPFGNDDLDTARLMHQQAAIWSKKGQAPELEKFLMGEMPKTKLLPEEMELAAKLHYENQLPDRHPQSP